MILKQMLVYTRSKEVVNEIVKHIVKEARRRGKKVDRRALTAEITECTEAAVHADAARAYERSRAESIQRHAENAAKFAESYVGAAYGPLQPDLNAVPDKATKEAFIRRCTVLIREVLPKVLPKGSKTGTDMVLDFLLRGTGKQRYYDLTIGEWQSKLAKIDAAKTPTDKLRILKEAA